MNDTLKLLCSHRSIRTFGTATIPDSTIRAAVAAAQRAATSSNIQAYCVIRVVDRANRTELVGLTGGQPQVEQCAAFFVICGDQRRHRLIARRVGMSYDTRLEGFVLAVIDASLFAQNLVVAFESFGFGTCCIGGLRNDLPAVDALLKLPEGVLPLFGLCVGEPAEDPECKPRLALEAVLFEDRYPDDDAMADHLEAYDEAYRSHQRAQTGTDRDWSSGIARKFSEPRRPGLSAYYRSKGAGLG